MTTVTLSDELVELVPEGGILQPDSVLNGIFLTQHSAITCESRLEPGLNVVRLLSVRIQHEWISSFSLCNHQFPYIPR